MIQIIKRSYDLIDERIMSHGERTAYLFFHILKSRRKYTDHDLKNLYIIGLLHDIGAYKTDDLDLLFGFEEKRAWAHAIYGYLYLKYLSPISYYSPILLYHHLNYSQFQRIDYPMKEASMLLSIADRAELILRSSGYHHEQLFHRLSTMHLYPSGVDTLKSTDERLSVLRKAENNSYRNEMDEIYDALDFNEKDCREFLKLLVFSIDFKNEDAVINSIMTNILSIDVGKRMGLDEEELEVLDIASLVYDLGMLSIDKKITGKSGKLTEKEFEEVKNHVNAARQLFQGVLSDKILDIISCHHERLDGSGYPENKEGEQLSLSQRILAVTDTISALSNHKAYRPAFDDENIKRILQEEADGNRLCGEVVRVVLSNYEDILKTDKHYVNEETEKFLAIKEQYGDIAKKFEMFE